MTKDPVPDAQTAAKTVRALHDEDPTAQTLQLVLGTIEAPDPGAIAIDASMVLTESHCNFMGSGHGGVIFTACDVVLSYLSNAFGTAVATHASIDFVAPVRLGDRLDVAGRLVERFGRNAVFDVTAFVGGSVVALFRGATREVRPHGK